MFSAQQTEEIAGRTTGMMSLRKEASSPMKSQCSSADVSDRFLTADWNPLVSVDRNEDFNVSSGLSSYYVTVPPIQGEQFQSPLSIPEVVSSTGLLKNSQFSSAPNFQLDSNCGIEKNLKGKKRKGVFDPGFPMEILPTDVSPESMKNSTKKDEKKHETENVGGTNQEECSQGGEAPKEDYIHIRAKRGQATNSHSLAERVRREKISERMKLLQDLVPGCNKINGKAMMLDEIINYVQSLQRQVEFLSMKLSAVNPELPFEIEQIFSKDILHSRDASLAMFGCGASRAHFPPLGIMQQEMAMCNMPNSVDMMRSTFPQVSPMPQLSSVWDDELQTVLQMGFMPNQSLAITDPNGTMKTDE